MFVVGAFYGETIVVEGDGLVKFSLKLLFVKNYLA